MIVDSFNALLRTLVGGYAAVFGSLNPLIGLSLISVLIGIGMLWVVGKVSNQKAIERAKKLMQAHLLEMRIYRDEPALLVRAQGNLILNNCRYISHMLRPALFLTLPMVILYAHFDAVYGWLPLQVGESTLLTVQTELAGSDMTLTSSDSIEVVSVSVTIPEEKTVSWTIKATSAGTQVVTLNTPNSSIDKSVRSGNGILYLSNSRQRSSWQRFLLTPGENGFTDEQVAGISLDYMDRSIGFGSFRTHWVFWLLGISILTAYVLKGYFGVVL